MGLKKVKKFLSYYRPYTGLFIKVMTSSFIVGGISLAFPLCVRYITKNVLEGDLTTAVPKILWMGVFMLLLLAAQTACNYYYDYRGHSLGARMESDLRSELFDHFQKLSFTFYNLQKTGQLMSRLTNDLLDLTELYHHGPEDLIQSVVKLIGAFFILLAIDVPLTLVVFLFIPLMAVYAFYFSKRMYRALKHNRERIGDINAQVEDNLSGIRVVKSFANEPLEADKFALENNRFLDSRKDTYRNEAYFSEGITAFTLLITVVVVVFGGLRIVRGSLDLADLLVFLLYIGNFTEPIQRFTHFAQQFQEGITGFLRFMEIMDIAPEADDASDAIDLPLVRGEIAFHHVGFKYQDGQTYVLRDVSLQARAGETLAIVGPSGAGKTTLCALIPRFFEVTQGQITLDGVDIRRLHVRSLRKLVGVVQQDVYLFAGTVAENIRYGRPGASREELIAAAKKADAHDFIMALPDGYDTDIGQRGVKLSGGQRQRLSIARVFLKDPPVLIFDEATSALDSESERVILDSLEALSQDRTTFVIAHRLSTIRNARRILVLTEQGIEEQGSHAELMALGGTYARLYQAQ